MKTRIQNPFANLFHEGSKVMEDMDRAKREKRVAKPKRRKQYFLPFVLQAYNGSAWKVVYNKGQLVVSKRHPSKRNMDFVHALKEDGFVDSMKIQVFGHKGVTKKTLHSTPIRWRRIDRVGIGA